ncbi:phage tail tape measure protein [Haloferax sp. Atlit-4N]|uniref:phage tail tape measure protein n=1 Tax=Haloferax sp. Atlit-4N TaxID=2077206 RepID=UPI000E22F580|nr:phage tail tape measure protein [Haloferax sp. Atlit-4N]RDZ53117.1 phage tail tape measure protein [Haloferax sp. Atlit-4N]
MVFTGSDTVEQLRVEIVGDGDGLETELASVEGSLMSMTSAAGIAGGAIAAMSAVMAGQAVDAARQWETALTDVEKVTSEATADELRDSLLALGSDLAIPTRRLAQIAEIAGRLGVTGTDNIEAFTETIGKMAAATDLSAEQAANDIARLANALSVPIEEAENMGSAINEISNNVAASSSEIVSAMSRAAPAAGTLGVKFAELVAISGTLVASGMQVERSGTRTNEMFNRLAENVPEVAGAIGMTAEEFQRLIEEDPTEALFRYLDHLQSIEGSTARVTEATEIFGRSGGKAVLTLAQNFDSLEQSVRQSESAYRDATSVQSEYAAQADTLDSQITELQNSVFEFGTTTGEQMLPAVTDAVSGLGDLVDAANDANNATDGLLGTVALTGGIFGGTAAPIAAFVSGPIGWLIAGAGAASIAYQTNFADIQTTVDSSLARVTDLTQSHLSEMNEVTERELAKNNSIWAEAMEKGEGIVDVGVQSISGLFITELDAMLSANRFSLSVLTGDWDRALDTVQGFTVRAFVGLLDYISSVGGKIGDEFATGILDGVNQSIEGVEAFVQEYRDVLNIISTATGANVQISEDFEMEKLALPGEGGDSFSVPRYAPETATPGATGGPSDPTASGATQPTADQYAGLVGGTGNQSAGMPMAEFTPAIEQALTRNRDTLQELKELTEERKSIKEELKETPPWEDSWDDLKTRLEETNERRQELQDRLDSQGIGVPGYVSDPSKIENRSMQMTPELFRALANQQGGVTASKAGLSEAEFARVSNMVLGSGFAGASSGSVSATSMGGATPAVASSMQKHVSSFGDHVAAFARAVENLQATEWRVTASDEFVVQQREVARDEVQNITSRYRRGVGPS